MFTIEQYPTGKVSTELNIMRDLHDINELNRRALKQARTMTYSQFLRFLKQQHLVFVVARHAETKRIIGKQSMYTKVLDDGEMIGYVDQVATHPDFEGKGIGTAVGEKIEAIARKKQIDAIDLTSGDEKIAAHALYKKLGFKKRETNNFRKTLVYA